MAERLAIAKRGTEPAYVNAPPRKRQSDIEKPFMPIELKEPGFLARLFGWR